MKKKKGKPTDRNRKSSSKKGATRSLVHQASKGTIFISGYWPPTNIEAPFGMLKQFRSPKRGTLGEYIIDNYRNTGYQVVTIATEFPDMDPNTNNWGSGVGFWTVDYPLTSFTFWSLMQKYSPCAVMTTSRNLFDKRWVMEIGAMNLPRNRWYILPWNEERPPYIGGSDSDPALPNVDCAPMPGNPPDATVPKNTIRPVTEEVSNLQQTIIEAMNRRFDTNELLAVKDTTVQGDGGDNYVSGFAGYHAVWYNDWSNVCRAGWHTHVGFAMTTDIASKAIRLQLRELIKWLDAEIT